MLIITFDDITPTAPKLASPEDQVVNLPRNRMVSLSEIYSMIQNVFNAVNKEEIEYKPIPEIRKINNMIFMKNFTAIKEDIEKIAISEMDKWV